MLYYALDDPDENYNTRNIHYSIMASRYEYSRKFMTVIIFIIHTNGIFYNRTRFHVDDLTRGIFMRYYPYAYNNPIGNNWKITWHSKCLTRKDDLSAILSN